MSHEDRPTISKSSRFQDYKTGKSTLIYDNNFRHCIRDFKQLARLPNSWVLIVLFWTRPTSSKLTKKCKVECKVSQSVFAGRSLACFSTKYIPNRSRRSDGYYYTKNSCSFPPSLLCKRSVFTIANSAIKITSADRSDFLSSNMAAQLSSLDNNYLLCKAWLSIKQFKIRVRRSGSNFILKLIMTRICKGNYDWPRRQLRHSTI